MLITVASLVVIGFVLNGLGHLALGIAFRQDGRKSRPGRRLICAVVAEIVWSVCNVALWAGFGMPALLLVLVEVCRNLAWLLFLWALWDRLQSNRDPANSISGKRLSRFVPVVAICLLAAVVLLVFVRIEPTIWFAVNLAASIAVIVFLEQIWRNTAAHQQWAMKLLYLAMLSKFGFDAVMYANAMLYANLGGAWLAARPFANAALIPLLAISTSRNGRWDLDIKVSRDVVFHSVTLLIGGVLLLVIALGGYLANLIGGSLGGALTILILFAGLLSVIVLLASGSFRTKLRIFIAQHLFSYRYDYRKEWLELAKTMSDDVHEGTIEEADKRLAYRSLSALANIMNSGAGVLWLRDDAGDFRCEVAKHHIDPPTLPADDDLIAEIRETMEVTLLKGRDNILELNSTLSLWLHDNPSAAVIVPLLVNDEVIGLVVIDNPKIEVQLGWEEREILAVAANQIASYLTIGRAMNALAQARQFESFNQMSAFVVHDLKNLVSEMGLVLRNAQKHRDDPEFQEDMLETVRETFEQMNALLLQLSRKSAGTAEKELSMASVLEAAVNSKQANGERVILRMDDDVIDAYVQAEEDRLTRIIGHLIQNAIEASDIQDKVEVISQVRKDRLLVEVNDQGEGMSEQFIRDELFKPFASGKDSGMGIGMFECREYVRELKGRMKVVSKVGQGTRISIDLPIKPSSESQA